MAKFKIESELDFKGVEVGAREIDRRITALRKSSSTLNKELARTGDIKFKSGATKDLQRALDLAKAKASQLERELNKAMASGKSPKSIIDLQTQLIKAKSQVTSLEGEMAKIGTSLNNVNKSGSGMNEMLANWGNFANVLGGIKTVLDPIIGLIKTAVGTAVNLAKTFASNFMDAYDQIARSNLTLKNTLLDGQQGINDFNNAIKGSAPVIRAQAGELREMGATLASYSNLTGKETFRLVNAINNVGDAMGATLDQQKAFALALGQAQTAGKLMAQDFNQMSQTALGKQFKNALISAKNEMLGINVTAESMTEKLQKGGVSASDLANVFGSDWVTKMAAAEKAQKGIEVSTGMVTDQLKQGKIPVEDFIKVFGEDFVQKLTDAANSQKEGAITAENFRTKMSEGAFTVDVMNKALDKFVQQGNELPQVFSTFSQVREAVKNGFYTGAVTGFQESVKDSAGTLTDFGTKASEFAEGAGLQLGRALGDAAQKVLDFIDANGGIEGVFSNLSSWASDVIEKFQSMANNILVVIGNLLSLKYGKKELENMGFQVDQTTGMVTGWKAKTDEQKQAQDKLNASVGAAANPTQKLIGGAQGAKDAMGELRPKIDETKGSADKAKTSFEQLLPSFNGAKKGADNTKQGVKQLVPAMGDLQGSAKETSKKLDLVATNRTVSVDTSSAQGALQDLSNWALAAKDYLGGVLSAIGGGWFSTMREAAQLVKDVFKSEEFEAKVNVVQGEVDIDTDGVQEVTKAMSYTAENAGFVDNMFRGVSFARPSTSNNQTIGDINITVQSSEPTAVVDEIKTMLRRNGINLRFT